MIRLVGKLKEVVVGLDRFRSTIKRTTIENEMNTCSEKNVPVQEYLNTKY